MKKEIKLKRIKETEIVKRLTAELPPWWRKVRNYSAMIFIISSGLAAAAPVIGIPAFGITIIAVIIAMSGAISGAAQMTKK